MANSSNIFSGYRALGFITNHVTPCVRYHQKHKENYVITCVGKSFQVYNCSKLGIISISNAHPDQISCLACDALYVFTACQNIIRAFTRGKEVRFTYTDHDQPVHLLLPFGHHLLSVDEGSCVKVWDIVSQEVLLEMQFDNQSFRVSALLHPSTYVNKVLFGSQQGSLQLWNIRTNKQLYRFPGWGAAVVTLQQAPAVDVVAVGLSNGQAILLNIKYDETLMTFTQDWGPVTAISFRTDGHPVMVTGSPVGHVALWDLEEKRLQSQMRSAHTGAVTGLHCLPGEPLMVSTSPDNSLKVWIFDLPDGGGRLLRRRCGHSAPPSIVQYYGPQGHSLLSAGQDSTLQSFSTVHDSHNRSLGRASYNKAQTKKAGLIMDQHMMPPITALAAESNRQSDWDTVVACHRGERVVTTWNYRQSTMGAHRLLHDRFTKDKTFRNPSAQCVEVTRCGNFALIGYSTGHVDVYNMQSGLHRGSYGNPTAHKGSVRGVCVDGLNQQTITAGADQKVRFWRFQTKQLIESMSLETQISKLILHRDSAMLAVATDDFKIVIIDIDTRRTVREFQGHSNAITDLAFSADSRWLLTSAMDATVRTWDLPTGRLVDCFQVDSAVTSLALSPTSDLLATTHVDDLGVYLWSNMTLYTHVTLRPLPADYEPQTLHMPGSSTDATDVEPAEAEDKVAELEYQLAEFKSPDQISGELITLSMLPNSRWLSLANLDVIKQRNKPKEPPKVPKAAPFFLPTIPGLEPKFDLPKEETDDKNKTKKAFSLQSLTEFGKKLESGALDKQYGPVGNLLREMGPSAVDLELRCLAPEGGGSLQLMASFLDFVKHSLLINRDFELVQAYLALFLKLHGDVISREKELVDRAAEIQAILDGKWKEISTLFNQSICLANYLKTAVL